MRDGIGLSADIYRPAGEGKWPAILIRTPYVKSSAQFPERVRRFVERGYLVVVMDVRGRGDSEGEFVPYQNEGRDGYDSVEWLAAHPLSNDNVGTLGSSYVGRSQWLTALEHPPHLKAMVVETAPPDPFVEWPAGVPHPIYICWYHMTSGRTVQNTDAVDWMQVYQHLPLFTMDEAAGREIPAWREAVTHDTAGEYWSTIRYQDKFEQVDVPILHISGWYDDEQVAAPMNYRGMVAGGATPFARRNQRLLMGPWTHQINSATKLGEVDFGPDGRIDLDGRKVTWFDRWLKGIPNGVDEEPPVRIFVMGKNVWRDEHEWPLARTEFTSYFLHSDGAANSSFGSGLLSTDPPVDEPVDGYTYDPGRPVPFITEPTSHQVGGPDDYAAIERRDDVLVYTTRSFKEAVEVTGPVTVELFASSSAPDTNFMAMLLDVHPSGFAQRLTDGMVRARFRYGTADAAPLEPGGVERFRVDLWNTCIVVLPGHRLRLQITSSAFPKYARNPNTGGPLATETRMQVAEQHVRHDAHYPSRLILPIIPAEGPSW